MSYQVGIIGCGGMGAAHLNAYMANGIQVIAVADPDTEAAAGLADKADGAAVYADAGELIRNEDIDIVSICTPPVAHESPAVMALERGVNVLCEKPMAHDVGSARRMRDAAAASSALLMPAFRHRFIAANVKMKQVISSGGIGSVVALHNVFAGPAFHMEQLWFTRKDVAGGGCILDTSSHSVDLFRFLIGEIVEQHAVMSRHFGESDVEDAGILCVKAANGALGSMSSSFVYADGMAFIDIVGTEGRLNYDYYEPDKVRMKKSGDSDWSISQVAANNGFVEQVAHLTGAIEGRHPLAITPVDGVRAMEVILSVYPSDGTEVVKVRGPHQEQ